MPRTHLPMLPLCSENQTASWGWGGSVFKILQLWRKKKSCSSVSTPPAECMLRVGVRRVWNHLMYEFWVVPFFCFSDPAHVGLICFINWQADVWHCQVCFAWQCTRPALLNLENDSTRVKHFGKAETSGTYKHGFYYPYKVDTPIDFKD